MTDETPDPPPPVRRRPVPWVSALVGLAGLAVGALAVGAAWLVSGPDAVDRRPVRPPQRIGQYVPIAPGTSGSSGLPEALSQIKARNEHSSQLLSESHRGAGALVDLYVDQDIRQQLTVMIYRAPSPHPLYAPYEDAASQGLAKSSQTVEEFGQVSCVVHNDPTPAGQTPEPESAHAVTCSRTNATLTVEITPNGTATDVPSMVAALVDEAWSSVI
ncbi:hypothetical protein [Actinocrispum wychmicini]|uniref:Uncharacterized protein n=1 Tax=Actinocrispum wychmicini TaxID=1213861 RepID=A0A4R2JMG1_9PSEU|nr:hypothetical protein [Actinocrispum wychmicini]TCO60464.1 hypothetical protein EV192_10339 [Actinocrispum wychmicini]